jgi:DNA transformation protein
MFSGVGIYHESVIFGLAIAGDVFLKTDAESEPLFSAAGCRPFSFARSGKRVDTSYFSLPSEALDDPDAIRLWAARAYEAALRAEARKGAKAVTPRAGRGGERSRGPRRGG